MTANSSSSINQELTVFRETTATREAERYYSAHLASAASFAISARSFSVSLSERAALHRFWRYSARWRGLHSGARTAESTVRSHKLGTFWEAWHRKPVTAT